METNQFRIFTLYTKSVTTLFGLKQSIYELSTAYRYKHTLQVQIYIVVCGLHSDNGLVMFYKFFLELPSGS